MEKRSVKLALSEADFELRPLREPELRAIVRAMLTLGTLGVLFTGVDHTPIGCNAIFGEIFRLDPKDVPQMEIEELRGYVYPRLANVANWLSDLEAVYEEPHNTFSDELCLQNPHAWIRRNSTPLVDSSGAVIGRLWTFEDITEEKVRARRREVVQRLSVFHHPDPKVVCQEILDSVANFYQSTSILSIHEGESMIFRLMGLPPPWAEGVTQNLLKDSFCKLVFEQGAMAIVQDARQHPKVCDILPVRLGLVARYLGVPLLDSSGKFAGTLCIVDSKCEEILNSEDAEFMAVMANRVSVELERERLFELRGHEQKQANARQASELASTQTVLHAMNQGVALAETVTDEAELMAKQEQLLKGILGFRRVHLHVGAFCGDGQFQRSWKLDGESFCIEFIGANEEFPADYLEAHMSAIADQVALTLASFRLQRHLVDAHEHLREAQDRLVQAEKLGVVGALAATVAHDIRNIMASISLAAASSDDPSEVLMRVRRQVERFSVLSHRLLSYVKPKFMAKESLDLNAVLGRALELLEPQVRASKIKLSIELAEGLPKLEGDPNQVEHLFVNLIVNALQAVSRSDGMLKIISSQGPGWMRYSLIDNGRGIESEHLDQIFDPFYSSRPDGFGLGLFSCKRIAEEHGWKLNVRSDLGNGSEFILEIPLGQP